MLNKQTVGLIRRLRALLTCLAGMHRLIKGRSPFLPWIIRAHRASGAQERCHLVWGWASSVRPQIKDKKPCTCRQDWST